MAMRHQTEKMTLRRRLSFSRSLAVSVAALALISSCTTVATAATASERVTIRHIGDVGQYLPHVAGLALLATRHDHEGLRQLAVATASTLSVVYVLKFTVNRRRPDGGTHSFPSGHTAMAFAGAGFIQRRYGWALGVPAYAVGASVGWTRVYTRRHYTSDCLVGGALGVASNLVFTHRVRHVSVVPMAGDGSPGVSVSFVW
jgi:membrane-associated phospholipid phosphatase